MQCKRMHRPVQLRGERRIDLLMPGHPRAAVKTRTDQHHPKMGFRIGWYAVLVAFIGDLEKDWGEHALQLLLYLLLYCHNQPAWIATHSRLWIIAKVRQTGQLSFCAPAGWREIAPASAASTF